MFCVVFFGVYCVFLKPLEEMKMKKFLAVAMCMLLVSISVSQAAFVDIPTSIVNGNIAPTGTMTNYGDGVNTTPFVVGSAANLNVPGSTGNGAVSVPVYAPGREGANDTEVAIWCDDGGPGGNDTLQVVRLTFPEPVDLVELGVFETFAGVGNGFDRFGNVPSFRVNGGGWMSFGDGNNWGLVFDAIDWWDYASVKGDFTDVTTVDYRVWDWLDPYSGSPRIGAIVTLVPEPVTIALLSLGSLALLRKRR